MLPIIHIIDSICEVFLPMLYFATVLAYALSFFRDDAFARSWKSRLLVLTVSLHGLYILFHTVEYSRCMVTTLFEILSLVAFTIIATYWFIERRVGARETGTFMVGIAFLFEIISAIMTRDVADPNPLLKDLSIGLHISTAIFGFSGITISAVYGMLYLILYRELKVNRFGPSFKKLPSLEALEKLSTYATIVGFFFLSIAIGIGVFDLPRVFPSFSYTDPKLIVTIFIWAMYGGVLVAHYLAHIEGRRIMLLSLTGFCVSLFSMTIINGFLSGFHRFY